LDEVRLGYNDIILLLNYFLFLIHFQSYYNIKIKLLITIALINLIKNNLETIYHLIMPPIIKGFSQTFVCMSLYKNELIYWYSFTMWIRSRMLKIIESNENDFIID